MNPVLTRSWWKDAGLRAVRTAAALAIPYLGGTLLGAVPWLTIVSAAGLGAILSLLTSLVGIPNTVGAPLWVSLLEKSVKTFSQALVAGIGNAVLFQSVDWSVIIQTAALAALVTVLMQVVGSIPDAAPAPEAPPLVAPLAVSVYPAPGMSSKTIAEAIVEAQNGPRPPSGE